MHNLCLLILNYTDLNTCSAVYPAGVVMAELRTEQWLAADWGDGIRLRAEE
jgi:hypothetical protein